MIDVTAIEKCSSIAFLDAVFDAHARGEVVFPVERLGDAAPDGLRIANRIEVADGGGWFTRAAMPVRTDEPAQITLTSGTTGQPKPILLSHRALADVVDRLIDVMELTSEVREYVGVPVSYSFGFGRVRAVSAVGGACFLPENGFRVDELATMLRTRQVNALSAVPTLLRLVIGQKALIGDAGAALRWLEIGSQAMSADEKRAVREIFPNARIVQHYGLTEASRSTFLDISAAGDAALDTVGSPNGTVELRVTVDGLIAIRGPHVADGIVTTSGVEPLTDGGGWLVTRDLGHMEQGNLVFEGRVDHLLNVGGIKVSAEAFEAHLAATLPADLPFAVAGGRDALRGETIVIAYPDTLDEASCDRLQQAALAAAADYRVVGATTLFPMAALPLTDTGKVRRGEIGLQFDTHLEAQAAAAPPPGEQADVAALFLSVFGPPARDTRRSFDDLGGDSLHYVSILMGLEDIVPRLPDAWDALSIDALTTLAEVQRGEGVPVQARWKLPRNLDSVRGLACFLIVALHVVGIDSSSGLRLPQESYWHQVMQSLNLVRLPLFTAMAGFLYAAMPANRYGFGHFVTRKLSQMIVPALFAITVYWILRKASGIDPGSLGWGYLTGYLHLWYIYALFNIFVFAALLDIFLSSSCIVWITTLLLATIFNKLIPDFHIFQLKSATILLPYFAFGIILYRMPSILKNRKLSILSSIIAPILIAVNFYNPYELDRIDTNEIWHWLCGFSVVIISINFWPRSKILDLFAKCSFTIYFWHPASSALVRSMAKGMGLNSTPFLFVLGLLAGILIPIAIHYIMVRAPAPLSKLIIGR